MGKRPRELPKYEYTIHTKKEETLQFLNKVEHGIINPVVRVWDKESWVIEHKHANSLATWLLKDNAVIKEVLMDGQPTVNQ